MNIIIVDDELHSRETTKMLLESCSYSTTIKAMASDAISGAKAINKLNPDLVILDVQMPGIDGLEMLDLIPAYNGEIIFLTAHDQYAVEAFKKGAVHYLLKPLDLEDLEEALERLRPQQSEDNNCGKWLTISTQEGWQVLRKSDIYRCESDKNYTTIYTEKEKYIVSKTMKEVEDILPKNLFYRVHASHIVNIEKTDKILKTDGGSILLQSGDNVPISRGKKKEFFEWFQKRMDIV